MGCFVENLYKMKKIFLTTILVISALTIVSAGKKPGTKNTNSHVPANYRFSKALPVDSILKKYTSNGIPGASVAVYSEQEGWWAGSAGYARVENQTLMTPKHLQYLQSIAKTYMAVAILKLYEEGKIELDAPMTKYLPSKHAKYIKGADDITIRMLLNHTSGVPEYSIHPAFVSYVLLHPTQVFNVEDALKYLADEDVQFVPGSKHRYTNTNYLLLAMIADAIVGDHADYIDKVIFQPLGLTNTFYRKSPGYLKYPNLVDSYWDVLNTGKPANITPLQKANVATLKGDDGIVCTTADAIKFLKGLVEGKLLKQSTLNLMKQWVKDDSGNPIYGLGLAHYEAGGLKGYGHSGGGIGAGCILIYVPEKKVYIFMATNFGTLFGGDLAKKADDMKNEILAAVLF